MNEEEAPAGEGLNVEDPACLREHIASSSWDGGAGEQVRGP